MLLQWGVRVFPYNLGEPIVSGIFCVESIFNTVSGKSHILQGCYESEAIILYIDNAFATMPKGYTNSITSVHFMNYHFVWCPK